VAVCITRKQERRIRFACAPRACRDETQRRVGRSDESNAAQPQGTPRGRQTGRAWLGVDSQCLCVVGVMYTHELLGIIHDILSGATPRWSSQMQQSMPVRPAPITTYLLAGVCSLCSSCGGVQIAPLSTGYGGGRLTGSSTLLYVASTCLRRTSDTVKVAPVSLFRIVAGSPSPSRDKVQSGKYLTRPVATIRRIWSSKYCCASLAVATVKPSGASGGGIESNVAGAREDVPYQKP
jgi:hypothetical protein